MTNEIRLDAVNEAIGEVATDIAQAYAEFGNLTSMFLGQTSSTLQLRLFRPLALEVSLYMCALLLAIDKSLTESVLEDTQAYAADLAKDVNTVLGESETSTDPLTLFIQRCQAVVAQDSLWLSTQRQDAQPQISISDKGYIAIQKGAARLQGLVALL